jgi:hypothetical protein
MLEHGFSRQAVTAANIEELRCCQANVCSFVEAQGCPAYVSEWDAFFEEIIPKNPIAQGTVPIKDSDNWLLKLYNKFGGPPRRKNIEHLRERETLSKFSEPCSWPDAPWTHSERDATAQYAIATDVNSSLLIERTDVKRKRKKSAGGKPVLVPTRKNTKSKKMNVTLMSTHSDCDSTGSFQPSKKKPRGRPPKKSKPVLSNSDISLCSSVDLDDCVSACSDSTGISSLASSKLDRGDSDIDATGCWEASTGDEECSVVTDNSDYSYINLPDVPTHMKGKDIAEAYWKMIGRQFMNTDDDEVYTIIHICEFDFGKRAKRMLDKLCFRYAPAHLATVTTDDLEIALCSEMMNCDWVQWVEEDTGEEKAF